MDDVFRRFLENTALEAVDLENRSDVLRVDPLPPRPPSRYVCRFEVPFLRRLPSGTVAIDPGPVACCISFPEHYLRAIDQKLFMKIAAILTPDLVHPNVLGGIVCLGAGFPAGAPLGAIIWQLFEIVTYRNCTIDERNALNGEACRLLRAHPSVVDRLERPRLFRPRSGSPAAKVTL